MKKKLSIREQREQNAARTRQAHQQKDLARQEELRAKKEAEEAAAREKERQERLRKLNERLNPVRQRTFSEEKKSTAKAAGLKSTFILGGDELLMTSFGKGNNAIVEKHIIGDEIISVANPENLSVKKEDVKYYRVNGRIDNASVDNPFYHKEEIQKHDDLIHARSALEKRYFGKPFEDNIHIQCIHSILDIEKILSVHINNIVYMLTNFLRVEGEDTDDMISYLTKYDGYKDLMNSTKAEAAELRQLFLKLCQDTRQLGYLNIEILKAPKMNGSKAEKDVDPNTIKLTEEEFFWALYSFGIMRQMLVHGDPNQNIYKVEGFSSHPEITALRDRLYAERVNDLNNGFLDKAKKNLVMLFRAFSVKDREKKAIFVRDYYNFTVRKQYKNMGFSIKLLREHMSAEVEDAFILRDKGYDSVRGKLYPFVDFAIFRYYQENPVEVKELVDSLRASFSEKEKDEVYSREAARIWPKKQISDLIIHHILPEMNGDSIKTIQNDADVSEEMLNGILITTDATCFTKFIYLVTMFINGKEINDLLTNLIHQMENIDAFIQVMKSQNMETAFFESFTLFALSKQVSEELRVVNSFARMSKPSAKTKEIMLREAFKVLGIKADEAWLDREIKEMTDPKGKNNTDPKVKQKRGVRNFINNNVIESDRFKYLVRYGNVNKIKGIAQNRQVILFVLKDIPDDQIVRYYNSVTGNNGDFRPDMRDLLADRITGFSFEDIQSVRQRDVGASEEEQEQKRQKKALVRLYLSAIYLVLKNLVYINSRYALAFHCLERDRQLLEDEICISGDKDYGLGNFAFAFQKKYPMKNKVMRYMETNFGNCDPWAIKAYRNKIEHLDAVRNADRYLNDVREFKSWFELYHYILQRSVMDQFKYESEKDSKKNPGRKVISKEELNPKTLAYFSKVETYRTCCKDFIKALNTPFAYNLPRYKNLSIDELFDRNRPLKKENGMGRKLEHDEQEGD